MKKLGKLVLIFAAILLFYGIAESISDSRAKARLAKETAAPAPAAQTEAPRSTPVPAAVPAPRSVDPASVATERAWSELLRFPSLSEIEEHDRTAMLRSPYLQAWMSTPDRYVAYSMEFKADLLPPGTYCSMASFDLDYSALNSRCVSYRTDTDYVKGYAGLQRQSDGRTNAILSFWDVFCTDPSGEETVIRATRIYPEDPAQESFGGEGTGAHYLAPYDWQAGHWMRMLLRCGVSEATGNTTVEQWVTDLESGEESLLCIYDLGVPDVCFVGNNGLFLENFDPRYSGDLRTMECRNIRAYDAAGNVYAVTEGYFSIGYFYPGSYRYGSDGETFCLITSGIQDLAGQLQAPEWLRIRN